MTTSPKTLIEFVDELNKQPHASFEELASHLDIWAVNANCSRQDIIKLICEKTLRSAEEKMESRPLPTGEFIEFPVVVFSVSERV